MLSINIFNVWGVGSKCCTNPSTPGSVRQLSVTARDWTQEFKWSPLHSHIQHKAGSCFGRTAEQTRRSYRLTESSRTSYDLPFSEDHWLLQALKMLCKNKPPDFSPTEYWRKKRVKADTLKANLSVFSYTKPQEKLYERLLWDPEKGLIFVKIFAFFFFFFCFFHSV